MSTLQQSILMSKNRAMDDEIAEFSDALQAWKNHANDLKRKLALEKKLHATEVRKSDALAGKADALAGKADALRRKSDALAEKSDALAEKSDALAEKSDAYERALNISMKKSASLEVREQQLRKRLLFQTDRLSVAQEKLGSYSAYIEAFDSAHVMADDLGSRSSRQVAFLSGFEQLIKDNIRHGFILERFTADTEQEIKDAFSPLDKLDLPKRADNDKAIMRGVSAGDVHAKDSLGYIGTPRANKHVLVEAVSVRMMLTAAVAWAEYYYFTHSHKDKSAINQLANWGKQAQEALKSLTKAAEQGDMATVTSQAARLQAIEQQSQQCKGAVSELLQDARSFVDARILVLLRAVKFDGDSDPDADTEWSIITETIPPLSMMMSDEDGNETEVGLMHLSLEENLELLEASGINRMSNYADTILTNSHNVKNHQYTLKDGTVIAMTDETRPVLKSNLVFDPEYGETTNALDLANIYAKGAGLDLNMP